MVRLLFIDRRDLPVVWGHTRIEATPLRRMTDLGSPPFLMALATEGADGRWDVLGYSAASARRGSSGAPAPPTAAPSTTRGSSSTRTTTACRTAPTGSTWPR